MLIMYENLVSTVWQWSVNLYKNMIQLYIQKEKQCTKQYKKHGTQNKKQNIQNKETNIKRIIRKYKTIN